MKYFAGLHDFLSSLNYKNIGNRTYLISDSLLVNTTSGFLLLPATYNY